MEERFFKKVDKKGPVHPKLRTRCHLWTASGDWNGYGRFKVDGRRRPAHQVAWFLKYGVWPKDQLLHKCDVRRCVRTDHLFEGTQQDNMTDMALKGRATVGERHALAKLTDERVVAMRQRHAAGGITLRQLALDNGVSRRQATRVVRGEQWAHL